MPDDILFRFRNLAPISWDNVVNLIDILVVSYLIYRLLLIVRNARAWKIFMGIFMFVAVLFLSDVLGLRTLHWILDKATALGPVALVILLLPELRQALEGLGRFGGSLPNRLATSAGTTQTGTIDAIVASAGEMAAARIGAIIVIERTTHLNDIAAQSVARVVIVYGNGTSELSPVLKLPLDTGGVYDCTPTLSHTIVNAEGRRITGVFVRVLHRAPNGGRLFIDNVTLIRQRDGVAPAQSPTDGGLIPLPLPPAPDATLTPTPVIITDPIPLPTPETHDE